MGEHAWIKDGAADNPQILEIDGAQIQIDNGASDGAGNGIAAAALQRIEPGTKLRAANAVDDGVETRRTKTAGKVGIAGDDMVGPKCGNGIKFVGRRDRRNDRAAMFGKLHGCRANTARGTGDQHLIAGSDGGANQHVFGGTIGAGEGGKFGVAEGGDDGMGVT